MSTYNDFFMRPNFSTPEGQVPTTGVPYTSPDIIPYGTSPQSGYQQFFATPANWAKDLGQSIAFNQQNLIYLRAKNFAAGANSGTAYLYYSPSSVINWPSNWVNNQILVQPGDSNTPPVYTTGLSAQSNRGIAVANQPFVWVPNTPPPPGSSHYCLISRIVTAANPNPLPAHSQGTYADMVSLVHNSPGYGWRNVHLVDANAPDWTYQTMLTVPDTATAEEVHIYLACVNIPVGAAIAFSCSTLEKTSGPIQLAETIVTDPNMIAGVTVTLQPGFSGSIGVSYWTNGTTIQGTGGVYLEAALEADGASPMARYSTPELQERLRAAVGITPTMPVYLGQNTFKMIAS